MNLFTNAAYAMRAKGGVLDVSLDTMDITMDASAQFKGIKTGSYLELIVADTGCGIPMDLTDRIFETVSLPPRRVVKVPEWAFRPFMVF